MTWATSRTRTVPTMARADVSALEQSSRPMAPQIVRVLSHLSVWAAILVPTITALVRGWMPTGDDAAITFRDYQTFSLQPPVVGLASTASSVGHQLYDPGPLQFWLLAPFVQLDFDHGLLWGSALIIGTVLSTAIEAIWHSGRWLGCAALAFVIVDLLWLAPWVFSNLPWNAYFPIFFLIASIAFAWRVSTGAFGWWPVLIFTASVAAQCHLFFVPPALLLVLASPLLGLTLGKPVRYGWLITGGVIGLLCWLAPLIQHQNLIALWRGNSGKQTFGFAFGLKALARSASPVPIWLGPNADAVQYLSWLHQASAAYGVVVLLLLAVFGTFAWRSHCRDLAMLSALAFVLCSSFVLVFAVFPVTNFVSLEYLIDPLWVLGVLLWIVVGWSAWALLLFVADRRIAARSVVNTDSTGTGSSTRRGDRRLIGHALQIASLSAIALIAVIGGVGIQHAITAQPTDYGSGWTPAENATVAAATKGVEDDLPRQGLVYLFLSTGPGNYAHFLGSLHIMEGVAWRLESDGWTPVLADNLAVYTGTPVPTDTTVPAVSVDIRGTRILSIYEGYCWRGELTCYKAKPADVPVPVNHFRNLTFSG